MLVSLNDLLQDRNFVMCFNITRRNPALAAEVAENEELRNLTPGQTTSLFHLEERRIIFFHTPTVAAVSPLMESVQTHTIVQFRRPMLMIVSRPDLTSNMIWA